MAKIWTRRRSGMPTKWSQSTCPSLKHLEIRSNVRCSYRQKVHLSTLVRSKSGHKAESVNEDTKGQESELSLQRRIGIQPKVRTFDLLQPDNGQKLSNRALFKSTPIDEKLLRKIKDLNLCSQHRTAQRHSKKLIKDLKTNHPDLTKVPLQLRLYPLFGMLDRDVKEFIGLKKKDKLTYIGAASTMESIPQDLHAPLEIAFAGRSNVGKSSLINAVTLSSTARSANRPGVTQTLVFYTLRDKVTLVDLPGYGFAYANEDKIEHWNKLMDTYMVTRKPLKRVYVILDARHGIKQNDREFLNMLSYNKVKFQVVLNKTDTVKAEDLARRYWHVREELSRMKYGIDKVHMVSSRTGAGVCELTREIHGLSQIIMRNKKQK